MMDGYNFNGAKGYKDTKLALMMFANALHDRYHRHTGISFSSIYPGCIADSPLFREKVPRANPPVLSLHFCVSAFMAFIVLQWIVALPTLVLTISPLRDSPATLVPEVLPSVYEVHHRRVCERGGGRAQAVPSRSGPQVCSVGRVLVLEWRPATR
jgi:hypothetical protein